MKEKQYKIISPNGVPYELGETKAKYMVDKLGCKWEGKEPKAPLTANQVADLIIKVTNLDDLKQYESDNRQVVNNAYKKKLSELTK